MAQHTHREPGGQTVETAAPPLARRPLSLGSRPWLTALRFQGLGLQGLGLAMPSLAMLIVALLGLTAACSGPVPATGGTGTTDTLVSGDAEFLRVPGLRVENWLARNACL